MLFQFHKGTIRTILVLLEIVRFSHFNSIKVQLEQIASIGAYLNLTNFNSIKVQLELPPGVGG